MITIENNGSNIILFGRDEHGEAYQTVIKDFSPYFYCDDWKGNYKNIKGEKVSKVEVSNPNLIVGMREEYNKQGKKVYEADVRYVNRYIIDKIQKINSEPIKMCYIDIELARTENGYEDFKTASNPILSICCYDNFSEEYTQFCVRPWKDEKEMLQDFIKYIQLNDPDMLIAWNGDMFDFPFLVNRINKIGLNANLLSRNGNSYTTEFDAKIYGRVLFDLMRAYKKMISGQGRESWSLDYISKYELKDKGGKEKYKGELDDLYKNDLNKFIKYNQRDVELLVLLNEKLKIVEFFDEVRRLCFCRFEDVFMNSKIADCLCLKYAKDNGFVLPTSSRIEKEKFVGAYVKESEPKLHENIAVMDMKSLYPSIMIGYNTSYETLLDKKEDGCINMYDKYYYRKQRGIIPSIVKPLLDTRKNVARQMKEAEKQFGLESREYQTLWMNQYALKVIANSFYGVLGYETFRLFNRDVAQSITFAAQNIIKEVHKWFEDKGMKVIYGDTDSCFIEMHDKNINDMIQMNKEINNYFKDYFRQFSIEEEYNIFKLEFEKAYKTVLFKIKGDGTGAKKKYAGLMYWYDGSNVDKISITGFESVRSDSPQIGRDLIKKVLEMILRKNDKQDIDKYIEEFKNNIRLETFTIEEMALPIAITKELNKYGNQIHARAARIANEKHQANIKKGDKIKYVFIKGGDVVAFKNYMWDGYQIDHDKLIRRIVDMKIGPLYESLGWPYNYVSVKKTGGMKREPLIEERLKQLSLWN